jgi:serine/threonine protein kinase
MSPERWQQITDIFEKALELEEKERAAFIAEACADDSDLRYKVEKMLAAHDKAGDFISAHVMENATDLFYDKDSRLSLKPGHQLNHYRILKQIGEGGMGEVYLAEDAKLGRRIAIKVLSPKTTRNADLVRRFEQEARAASQLNHPNIAHIYEVGAQDGLNFMAMEFVEGSSLREKIQNRPLPVPEILDIALQIADALDETHTAGIIHRDIKAENIMVTRRGRVKILDFGLAKIAPKLENFGPTPVKTKSGVVMGTVAYMSPEQVMSRETDARTDIWSFGVLLYEMSTGRLPFQAESMTAAIDQVLHSQPEAITRLNYNVPAELEVIIKKTLRKKPEERYQSARDLLVDLENLKRELDSVEHSTAPGRRKEGDGNSNEDANKTLILPNKTAAPEVHQTSSAEYIVSEMKRHKKMIVVGVLAILLAVGGLAFAIYKFTGKPFTKTPEVIKVERLTTNGRAVSSAISPDGKNIVYTVDEGGKHSLWVKQVAASNTIQIIPPADDVFYMSLSFTPDSNYINFVKAEYEKNKAWDLYQMPVLGGPQKKLLSNMEGGISYSPDGKQIAFFRGEHPTGEESSLMIANPDGTGGGIIASLKLPQIFPDRDRIPVWSPDGQTIACITGDETPGKRRMDVVEVNVADGTMRTVVTREWEEINQITWLNDKSGLLILGVIKPSTPWIRQIWHFSYPDGEARRITADLNTYSSLSLTADAKSLVTVQENTISNLWTAPGGDASRAVQIRSGGSNEEGMFGLSWTPDGRIVFGSRAGGNEDIWIMNPDGSNPKQLTVEGPTAHVTVTPDGRYIVFTALRNDQLNIWRMDMDGGNAKQLTNGNSDWGPVVSADSKWIIYTARIDGNPYLWKVSIEGGDAVQFVKKYSQAPEISPDGKWIVCSHREGANTTWRYAIIPFAGGEPVKIFDLLGKSGNFRWSADSRSLYYPRDAEGRITNIWSYSIDTGQTKQLTDFKTEKIYNFALSPDGKQMIFARGPLTSDVVLMKDFR